MLKEEETKSVLSKTNSVGILVFLYESGGSSKATFVQSAVGLNYDSFKNSATRLEAAGLLTIVKTTGKSKFILYSLTQLGQEIARDLKRAQDRLNGIAVEDDQTDYETSSAKGNNLA